MYKKIIDDYDWDFTQIQYKYIDENYQAGTEGLLYAASKKLGIVIMEPLRGGALLNNTSKSINNIIEKSNIKKSPAEWAFKFLYDKDERETFNQLRDEFKSKIKVNCTGCKYCVPCHKGADIPTCFEILNNASMFDSVDKVRERLKDVCNTFEI